MSENAKSGSPLGRASTVDGRLNLQEFLPYRLSILADTVSQSLSQLYNARYGIAIPEWRVIAILGQYGTVTAKQIGACSRMHKTKVSRAVATLEHKGLVERAANSDDMREAFVTLSETGRAIYGQITPAAAEFADALLGALTAAERAHLEAILTRLNDHALVLADDIANGRPLRPGGSEPEGKS
ncbi:MarR family transcriptional regulator [Breoghania sp. L-A4]|uniref:MarR family winged helix-turn-helix transcriptional regulator n=1 Tax=Breoghania sp. L-A4 TaxID=2304600 RepID=UPI000E35F843|nr:MarR family transcriptional regulator [Breoghania sp. L-A4]AXS40319.1 MarR family transcriptional regulator [Breoghania sp. L-A4]